MVSLERQKFHKQTLLDTCCVPGTQLGPGNRCISRLGLCLWADEHTSKRTTWQCSESHNRGRVEWCEIKRCWIYWQTPGRLHRRADNACKGPVYFAKHIGNAKYVKLLLFRYRSKNEACFQLSVFYLNTRLDKTSCLYKMNFLANWKTHFVLTCKYV